MEGIHGPSKLMRVVRLVITSFGWANYIKHAVDLTRRTFLGLVG
jgi:hypothetical protein